MCDCHMIDIHYFQTKTTVSAMHVIAVASVRMALTAFDATVMQDLLATDARQVGLMITPSRSLSNVIVVHGNTCYLI